ncbi:serine hydroxymethyltransferase [Planctomycetota bacterium]
MLLDTDAGNVTQHSKGLQNLTPLAPEAHGTQRTSRQYHNGIFDQLEKVDTRVAALIGQEYRRQQDTLQLIAAENQCSRAVLAALGSIVQNKTTEGFIGGRYHGGCEIVDQMEALAIERAKTVFGAQYANVQAHSGTSANHIVFAALLGRDDRILSLGLDQGGHVSHGAPVSLTGRLFEIDHYLVDPKTFLLDYEAIRKQAIRVRPKLIVCGASAYSRAIDFNRFRQIADEVGAYLMADVSHIAGLIAAGVHPSPVDVAHFTTTSTYKPGGPRGGLILMGRDFDQPIAVGAYTRPLWEHLDKTTFPGVQGTPQLNNIAAKAVFFQEMDSETYRNRQYAIVKNAQTLVNHLQQHGFHVLTEGTDNHMALINVTHLRPELTGLIAQRCLEDCGIVVNMNRLPYDPQGQAITSGIRVGTPIVTRNGMQTQHMAYVANLLHQVLTQVQPIDLRAYELDPTFRVKMRHTVRTFCRQFPI